MIIICKQIELIKIISKTCKSIISILLVHPEVEECMEQGRKSLIKKIPLRIPQVEKGVSNLMSNIHKREIKDDTIHY